MRSRPDDSRPLQAACLVFIGLLPLVVPAALLLTPARLLQPGFRVVADLSLALTIGAAALAVALALRRARPDSDSRVPLLGLCLALSAALPALNDFWAAEPVRMDWFAHFEPAGKAVQRGLGAYGWWGFVYPPFGAHVLALVEQPMAWGLRVTGLGLDPWRVVFWAFEVAQFAALAVAFYALYLMARRLGLSSHTATAVVTMMFVVNAPLQSNFHDGQVNLIMLAAVCYAEMRVDKSPVLAGAVLAVGALLKIYPLVVIPAWWLGGRSRGGGSALAWLVALSVLTGSRGEWLQFVAEWLQPAGAYPPEWNLGLFAMLANAARVLRIAPVDRVPDWLSVVYLAGAGIGLVWLALRWLARRRQWLEGRLTTEVAGLGMVCDGLGFALLASPRVWSFHYLLVMPVAVYALVVCSERWRLWVLVSAALVFAVPDLVTIGLSYHAPVGIVLLLVAMAPARALARVGMNPEPRPH